MKTKLMLFGAGALVIAGALVYGLGIYPPASKRDTQGAIGQREVYRDAQAHDAAVTPGSAPVATGTQKVNATNQNAVGQVNSQSADFRAQSAGQVRDQSADFRAQSAGQVRDQSADFRAQSAGQVRDQSAGFMLQSAGQVRDQSAGFMLQSAGQVRDQSAGQK